MMYKRVNKLFPDHLIEKFTLRSQIHTKILDNGSAEPFKVPSNHIRNKNYRWIFQTFSEFLRPSTVSKNTIKQIGHHLRQRDMMGQSCPIYGCSPVLIARFIHRSTLHFAVTGSTVYRSNTWEKTWQGESLEHMAQYHIKFVGKSHYLKRSGRKAFVESLFSCS